MLTTKIAGEFGMLHLDITSRGVPKSQKETKLQQFCGKPTGVAKVQRAHVHETIARIESMVSARTLEKTFTFSVLKWSRRLKLAQSRAKDRNSGFDHISGHFELPKQKGNT